MLALVLVFSASGCWDRRETDAIAIVGALALDRISEGNVLVSIELISNEAIFAGPGQLASTTKLVGWVIREEAGTIPSALRNMQRRIPKVIFVGQVSTLVFGQNLAREGVADIIDYLAACPQFRRSMYVTTCDSGSGLLQRPFIHELASRTLTGLAVNSATTGKSVLVTLNEFLLKLSETGIEPITMHTAARGTHDMAIKRAGEAVAQTHPAETRPEPLKGEREIEGELPPQSPVLDPLREYGTAERIPTVTLALGITAFREAQMVGFLDGNDARGYLWVVGRVTHGTLEVPDPLPNMASPLALDIIRASSSYSVKTQGGKPSITCKINIELQGASFPMSAPVHEAGTVQAIEAAAKTYVEAEISRSLRIVREELRTDIYGFGQAIFRRNPKLWHALEPDWNDRGLQDLEVNLQVQVRMRSTGASVRRHRV